MFLGAISAFTASVTWALGSSAYAHITKTSPPSAVNFTRALIAMPAFLFTIALTTGWTSFAQVSLASIGWLGLSMLCSFVVGDVFFLFSTLHLGVPAALAIASVYPLWSALVGWLLLGEAVTFVKLAAVSGIVIGVGIVILSGARLERRPHYLRGICFAIITSFFWSLNTVAVARIGTGIDAHTANVIRMAFGLLLCPLVGWGLTGRPTFLIPMAALRRYGIFFLAEAYGGSFCFVYGLTHTPLAIAAALTSLAPVLATPVAWATRREPISLIKLGGIVLVVVGAYFLVR